MIHVWIYNERLNSNYPDNYVYNSDYTFDAMIETAWINDPNVIWLIKQIDNNDVIIREAYDPSKGDLYSNYEIISPVFGHIPPQGMSSSLKTVILLIKNPDIMCSTLRMGDNAIEALEQLADKYDITICAETSYWFNCPVHILNDDSYTKNKEEYIRKYLKLSS